MEKLEFIQKWKSHPLFNQVFNEEKLDYDSIRRKMEGLDFIKFNHEEYLYVLDLHQKNFFYYQQHSMFLGEQDKEHIKNQGYLYFIERMDSKDYRKILNVLTLFQRTHKSIPQNETILSYNVNVWISKNTCVPMTHKLKVIATDNTDKVWLVLISSSKSSNKIDNKISVSHTLKGTTEFYNATTLAPLNQNSADLTPREIEIIRLTTLGLTVNDIAAKLFISTNTIKYHKKNIFSKTHCRSSVELIQYAIQNHIIHI